MTNGDSSSFGPGSLVALFLCVFGFGILYFVLIFGMSLFMLAAFVPALVFVGINGLAVTVVVAGGKMLTRACGFAFYVQLLFLTAVYSAFELVRTFTLLPLSSVIWYIVYQLVVLFVYAAIASLVIFIGRRSKTSNRTHI